MRIGSHEYANEADDDIPKPAQSLGTPVPRQKTIRQLIKYLLWYDITLLKMIISKTLKIYDVKTI